MATYEELADIAVDQGFLKKVMSACAVAAENIRTDASPPANQAQREIWAKEAFQDPKSKACEMVWALLAANESVAAATILSSSDTNILSAVEAAVDIFAGS